jgi:hypothetical protein
MRQLCTKLGVQLGDLLATGEDHYPSFDCHWLASDAPHRQEKRMPGEAMLSYFVNCCPRSMCRISNDCWDSGVFVQSSDP